MPCESCNVQFTVFKRKRLCSECRRFYCSNCLIKRSEKFLCERCVVLTARPLSKVDLLKLKPKDLIFYLQSKHISTTGCVEKEELVNLVLTHVNNTSADQTSQSSNASTPRYAARDNSATVENENGSNPFDQIKQTCQSLFNSFAEKIVDLNFENKPTSNQQENISNQPRFQTRQMPTYASSTFAPDSQVYVPPSIPRSRSSTSDLGNANRAAAPSQSASSSNPSSPIVSIGSASSHYSATHAQNACDNVGPNKQEQLSKNIPPSVHEVNLKRLINNLQDVNNSGCECSDDETLTEFSHRYNSRHNQSSSVYVEKFSPASQTDSAFEDQIPGPSGSGAQSASPSKISSGDNQRSSEESSGSSFEELGAVGGTGDWQMVDKTEVPQNSLTNQISGVQTAACVPNESPKLSTTFHAHSNSSFMDTTSGKNTNKTRRINRRRSDTCVVNANSSRAAHEGFDMQIEDEESDEANGENLSCKRLRKSCHKCGKTKNSLKSKLLKLRRQFETTQMSDEEMKKEIEDFLNYLERKSKGSFDFSDSDVNSPVIVEPNVSTIATVNSITIEDLGSHRNLDDGIHVYGSRAEESYTGPWRHDNRFINLADFKSSSELEDLSVKQLKEILMLNRVDFKGCCEKQELLDRVRRLWNDLQTSPAVDKLQTDDLCKICMDAPIECVILECGHMATCTNCGKVLSECPICRQYIVRVVRFFRA